MTDTFVYHRFGILSKLFNPFPHCTIPQNTLYYGYSIPVVILSSMHISWLGNTCLKLQTKAQSGDDITLIIDPYKPATGVFPRSVSPDIALFTHGEEGSITLSGDPFVLASPGECETKGVLITAVQGHTEGAVLFRLDAEHMSLAHLGHTNTPLTDTQLEALSGVDMLCLPVGGGDHMYTAEQAAKVVSSIEPRVIIPIGHKSDTDTTAADVSAFVAALGIQADEPTKKVIFKKKQLPQDQTRVVILSKE